MQSCGLRTCTRSYKWIFWCWMFFLVYLILQIEFDVAKEIVQLMEEFNWIDLLSRSSTNQERHLQLQVFKLLMDYL